MTGIGAPAVVGARATRVGDRRTRRAQQRRVLARRVARLRPRPAGRRRRAADPRPWSCSRSGRARSHTRRRWKTYGVPRGPRRPSQWSTPSTKRWYLRGRAGRHGMLAASAAGCEPWASGAGSAQRRRPPGGKGSPTASWFGLSPGAWPTLRLRATRQTSAGVAAPPRLATLRFGRPRRDDVRSEVRFGVHPQCWCGFFDSRRRRPAPFFGGHLLFVSQVRGVVRSRSHSPESRRSRKDAGLS